MSKGSKDEGFRRVDRHGVALGVLKSSNKCSQFYESHDFKANKSGYHTISTVVLSLVSCLAKSPDLLHHIPIVPRFSEDEVGASLEEFISVNLNDGILRTFPEKKN